MQIYKPLFLCLINPVDLEPVPGAVRVTVNLNTLAFAIFKGSRLSLHLFEMMGTSHTGISPMQYGFHRHRGFYPSLARIS
jgi:hypothetical protein